MAKTLVVKDSLTSEMIEVGADLARRLQAAPIDVCACMWHFFPEPNVWRLVVASPEVAEYGPRKVYRKIRDVLSEIPEEKPSITLMNISAVAHDDSLVSLLRKAVRIDDDTFGKWFFGGGIEGKYIEETYIYFIS